MKEKRFIRLNNVLKALFTGIFLLAPCNLFADRPHLSRDPLTRKVNQLILDAQEVNQIKAGLSPRDISLAGSESLALCDGFISKYKSAFGLNDPSGKLSLLRTENDSFGFTHFRYRQYLKNLPVFGAELNVHISTGEKSLVANGKLTEENYDPQKVVLTKDSAKEKAITIWEERFGGTPEIIGEPELVWVDRSAISRNLSTPLRKSWMIVARSSRPLSAYRLFIDGESGELLLKLSLVYTDIYREVGDCADSNPNDSNCDLDYYDSSNSYTFGRSEGQPARGPNPTVNSSPLETDNSYTYLGNVHDYYLQRHGRNGANGNGGIGDGISLASSLTTAFTYVDQIDSAYAYNALFFSSPGYILFGSGEAVLDVVGHEYTHGVTNYSAALVYANESGALNEAFSDVFGEAVEYYVGSQNDWLQGAECPEGAIRNLMDPTSIPVSPILGAFDPQPDKLHSSYVYCGTEDQGGVHKNSGILNLAAYLTAIGGSFNGCDITGIGREKEENIFYRALTLYLTPTSGFNDAYVALNTACADLYSVEDCVELKKALRAVELNQVSPCSGGQEEATACATALVDDVTPPTPSLKGAKKSVTVTMTPLSGTSYRIKVLSTKPASNGKKAKKVTKYYTTTSDQFKVKGLTSGSSVTVSYFYVLDATPVAYSYESAKKRVKVK